MSASAVPLNSDTQTERLVLALRERILKGDFSQGKRLTEMSLVSLLQASRTPIRLALERLANEGLLDPIPTGGFQVRSFSIHDKPATARSQSSTVPCSPSAKQC